MDSDALGRDVGAVHQEADAATKRLFAHGGQPIYSPEQHRQKLEAIEATRAEKIERITGAALERAEREKATVLKELAPLEADPLYMLPTADLQRVGAVLPFLAADVAAADWSRLPDMAEHAAALGDKPLLLAFSRAVEQRAQGDNEGTQYVARVRSIVEAATTDKATIEKRDTLKKRLNAAVGYESAARDMARTDEDLRATANRLGVNPEGFIKAHRQRYSGG